jgi:hypothetical protein
LPVGGFDDKIFNNVLITINNLRSELCQNKDYWEKMRNIVQNVVK